MEAAVSNGERLMGEDNELRLDTTVCKSSRLVETADLVVERAAELMSQEHHH